MIKIQAHSNTNNQQTASKNNPKWSKSKQTATPTNSK
jgi:hypothetical protein